MLCRECYHWKLAPTERCPCQNHEAKAKSRAAVVQGHGRYSRKFWSQLQNTLENINLEIYQRKRKTKKGNCTLCRVRGKLLVGGVCGRNCLIILSLLYQMPPYYYPAVITLLPFQLKSNCPPFNWNRYGTNGYKSSGFRSHETTDVLG